MNTWQRLRARENGQETARTRAKKMANDENRKRSGSEPAEDDSNVPGKFAGKWLGWDFPYSGPRWTPAVWRNFSPWATAGGLEFLPVHFLSNRDDTDLHRCILVRLDPTADPSSDGNRLACEMSFFQTNAHHPPFCFAMQCDADDVVVLCLRGSAGAGRETHATPAKCG